jgi:RND superfamily putative drug exporter
MHEGVVASRVRTKRLGDSLGDAGQLGRALQSGYFVLAALDSAAPEERRASTFAVNLDRGGSAAQIVVIGEGEVWKSGHPLRERLEREIADLERATGGEARLGGPATVLQDFDTGTSGRFWILVLALMLVTYLVLVPVLRSLILPALAVVLNVMTVAAAFGVLVVLFSGDAPLGGPGWIDAIMLVGIFSIVFGLSIDYEVFLLARMREGWLRARDSDAAIRYGVERTAGVVTGAALIMTGVFVAFALTDLVSMRQFGIGLTVAVLLDATLVRLVLLPAAMRLCGDACWWLPAWLDRLLPELDVDGDREAVEGVGVLDDSATRQMRAPA